MKKQTIKSLNNQRLSKRNPMLRVLFYTLSPLIVVGLCFGLGFGLTINEIEKVEAIEVLTPQVVEETSQDSKLRYVITDKDNIEEDKLTKTTLKEIVVLEDLDTEYVLPEPTGADSEYSYSWVKDGIVVNTLSGSGTYSVQATGYAERLAAVSEGWNYTMVDGLYYITEVPDDSGTLVIPSTLSTNGGVIRIAGLRNANENSTHSPITNIGGYKTISFEEGITYIGRSAFWGCSTMTSLTLPSTLQRIENNAFFMCTGIKTLTLPSGLTYIGEQAFAYCTKLETINFPQTNNLTFANFAFENCIKLTSITIPSIISNLPYGTFSACTGLDSVTFQGNISLSGKAFSECGSLTVTVNANVIDCSLDAFMYCGALTINIGANTTYINPVFFSAMEQLSTINVAGGNRVYSTQSNILYNYDKTTLIAIPANMTSLNGIPNTVTTIGAYSCFERELVNLTIPASITDIDQLAFGVCLNLSTITFAAGSQLERIGAYAFEFCIELRDITIPESVESLGEGVFAECHKLTTFSIEGEINNIEGYEGWLLLKTNITTLHIGANVGYYDRPVEGYCTAFNWPPRIFAILECCNIQTIEIDELNTCYILATVNGVYGLYEQDGNGNAVGACFIEL